MTTEPKTTNTPENAQSEELSASTGCVPTDAQLAEAMSECARKICDNAMDLPPEYWQILNDNIDELLV